VETEIRTTLSGLDEGGALASFERMEDKVNEQEARAAALGEVESNSVDERFEALETAEQVERELAALEPRKAIPAPDAPPALPASSYQGDGWSNDDTYDHAGARNPPTGREADVDWERPAAGEAAPASRVCQPAYRYRGDGESHWVGQPGDVIEVDGHGDEFLIRLACGCRVRVPIEGGLG
jgi:hypothetical protein